MTHRTCLRCDWEGETRSDRCPNCNVRLYVVGASASKGVGAPPGMDRQVSSDPSPGTEHGHASDTRSDRSSSSGRDGPGSFDRTSRPGLILAALVLGFTLGAWLGGSWWRSAPAASQDAAASRDPTSAAFGEPVGTPSSTPPGTDPEGPAFRRHSLTVGGVPFTFRVPTDGWELMGEFSVNKSIVGPQGAEAIIFWTNFPAGEIADPCPTLTDPLINPSAADLAAAVAAAPGTELVGEASEVTVGGRSAEHVVVTVREDVGCDPGYFYTWAHDECLGACWLESSLGDTIRVWIVDVGGTRLFIQAETTKQSDPRLDREIRQIVGSVRFEAARSES
jgi:hypothetical protein